MTKLTEQQIEDLFKDAPEGCNYYVPEGRQWNDSWFVVENGVAVKRVKTLIDIHNCSYPLKDLLDGGAIKRPEPKEEASMTYTQEMADNGVLPVKGWSWNTFTY